MQNTSTDTPNTFKAWLPVVALAFSAFIFNTTEFVPVGLLPDIAKSFNMDIAHTGLLITGYAWVVALMSLPLTILTAAIERRKLLIFLFILFIASHILAGVAWSFATLMTARIGIACAHAVFWSITIPLAVRIAPFSKRSKALGLMVTGSSLATVLGVPIGTIIGQQVGWRITFLCIGAVAFLVILNLALLLPKSPSSNAGSLKSLPSLFKRASLMNVYLLTVIIVTGYFTAYTYITPFMSIIGGFSKPFIVFLLLLIGGSGIVGSYIFAKYAIKHPVSCFMIPLSTSTLCLFLIYLCTYSHYSAAILCTVWGASLTILALSLQSKVLDFAPDASDVAISMYSGIFNIGIGGGALAGSLVLIHLDTSFIGYVGGVIAIIAIIVFSLFSHKYWKHTQTNSTI